MNNFDFCKDLFSAFLMSNTDGEYDIVYHDKGPHPISKSFSLSIYKNQDDPQVWGPDNVCEIMDILLHMQAKQDAFEIVEVYNFWNGQLDSDPRLTLILESKH